MKIRIEVARRGSKAMLKRSKILTFKIKCRQINHIKTPKPVKILARSAPGIQFQSSAGKRPMGC